MKFAKIVTALKVVKNSFKKKLKLKGRAGIFFMPQKFKLER